jgi:superfamily II DNA or RNA helicase
MLINLRPYQEEAIERLRENIMRGVRRMVLVMATGSGKCQKFGTPVLRYDGRIVPIESVQVGDLLMGPDSKPRRVLSTTRGFGPLYQITPIKGEPWVCNDVHVLSLVHTQTGEIVDVDLQKYLASSKSFKNLYKQFSPEKGVDFEHGATEFPIDPYFLGVWYGDGTKGINGGSHLREVAVSKPDPEIKALAEEIARQWGLRVRTNDNGCPTHHIAREMLPGAAPQPNPLLDALRLVYGDGTHLPYQYITAARQHRQAFLAGLLDADGYLHNNCFEICQKVRGFADGICFLARSLGKRALMVPKIVNGETYWRVSLSGDFTDLPLRIPRKIPTKRMQAKCATRTGFSVQQVEDGYYAGFELDGDGRYLMGDFTVTHNTVVASSIIVSSLNLGNRSLFVAHRRELIKQCFCKLVRNGVPPHEIGIVMAGIPGSSSGSLFSALDPQLSDDNLWRMFARSRPNAPVQVGSIDSLRGRAKPKADLVIADEAHRSLSKGWLTLFENYSDAVVLGLTATPFRADGRGLGEFYGHLEVIATPSMLMREGHLVEPIIWTVPADRLPDLSKVKVRDGDYDEEQLAEAMDQTALIGDIVDHWERRSGGIRTVIFAAGVEHSKHIVSRFVQRGVRAEHLDGMTPTDQREAILRRIDTGETTVCVNVGVLTDGWDQPSVKCVVLARPTQSEGLHLQMSGRCLRPFNNQDAIILDHAGNMRVHGRPQDDREFSLEGRKKRSSSTSAPSCKTCECLAVIPSAARICPMCGHQFSAASTERGAPEEVAGELVEIPRSIAAGPDLREQWNALVERWHKANRSRAVPMKPGWVAMEFRQRTGATRIPEGCALPTLTEEQEAKLARFGELNRYAHANGWSKGRLHAVFNAQEKSQ